jgi:hypothetical protein
MPTVNREKWMSQQGICPNCYDRHPDTGKAGYISAYVWAWSAHERTIKLFEKHGWTYLRRTTRSSNEMVFFKPNN